jgi:hypothetical protein
VDFGETVLSEVSLGEAFLERAGLSELVLGKAGLPEVVLGKVGVENDEYETAEEEADRNIVLGVDSKKALAEFLAPFLEVGLA